jgi:hypothetical protein
MGFRRRLTDDRGNWWGIEMTYERLGNPNAPVVLVDYGALPRNPFIGRTGFAKPWLMAGCR